MAQLVAYATSFRGDLQHLPGDKGFVVLLCAIYMPFVMIVEGRFSAYYRWMVFLPIVIVVTSMGVLHNFRYFFICDMAIFD